MFNKSLIIFFVVIIILTVLNFSNINDDYHIEIFSLSNKATISENTIEEYYSYDLEKKISAKGKIIKACLNNLEYSKWEDYIEYIEIKLYTSAVLPEKEENLVISINLSKDLSLICIMNKVSREYVLYKTIKDLLPVSYIKFIQVPNENYNFLVVYQTLDERLGAYSYDEFLEIYMFKENKFNKLLKESLLAEEIYKKQWIIKDAPSDQWEKITVEKNIDFIMNDTLEIFVMGINNKYIGYDEKNIPSKDLFNLISSDRYRYSYFWNKEFENFSLQKKEIKIFDSSAIVIENNRYDFLYINKSEKLGILTEYGKTLYLEKKIILGD